MKQLKTERILIIIAACIFMMIGIGILLLGSVVPIQFNINGNYFTATYWEVASISMGGFLLWTFFYGVPLVMGLLGLVCWFALKYKPKKAWGIVLIVIGVLGFFSFIGIFYLVAGIMCLNNKYWREEKNSTRQAFE